MSTTLPVLFLDVDGVLNPYAAAGCPAEYEEFPFFPDEDPPIRLCRKHGEWVRELAERFEVVWATGWGSEANRLIAPVLGLSQLPLIVLPSALFDPREKVPAVAAYADQRPAVWIDDTLTPEAWAWASDRGVPTLLIDVDPAIGLTRGAVDTALSWAVRDHPRADQ